MPSLFASLSQPTEPAVAEVNFKSPAPKRISPFDVFTTKPNGSASTSRSPTLIDSGRPFVATLTCLSVAVMVFSLRVTSSKSRVGESLTPICELSHLRRAIRHKSLSPRSARTSLNTLISTSMVCGSTPSAETVAVPRYVPALASSGICTPHQRACTSPCLTFMSKLSGLPSQFTPSVLKQVIESAAIRLNPERRSENSIFTLCKSPLAAHTPICQV